MNKLLAAAAHHGFFRVMEAASCCGYVGHPTRTAVVSANQDTSSRLPLATGWGLVGAPYALCRISRSASKCTWLWLASCMGAKLYFVSDAHCSLAVC